MEKKKTINKIKQNKKNKVLNIQKYNSWMNS